MAFIVATNVVASRPPKRRPTGTPHARAKDCCHIKKLSRILLPSDVVKLHCKMQLLLYLLDKHNTQHNKTYAGLNIFQDIKIFNKIYFGPKIKFTTFILQKKRYIFMLRRSNEAYRTENVGLSVCRSVGRSSKKIKHDICDIVRRRTMLYDIAEPCFTQNFHLD